LNVLGETVDDLLRRAFTDPAAALERATALLPSASGTERVTLLRVMGDACRELRQVDDSVEHLAAAVDAATELDDRDLAGLALMSLAASLSYTGDFDRSLELATQAVALLDGKERIPALAQRATLLQRAGRNPEALRAFNVALDAAARAGDDEVLGDLYTNRGVLLGRADQVDAAEADVRRALVVFESHGWIKRAADARRHLAWLAARRGDLIESFRRFDAVEQVYDQLGVGSAVLPDRAEALLGAGLFGEALELAESSARRLQIGGDDVDGAEALMLVARAALLAGNVDRAAAAAGEATELFEAQGRAGWWAAAASLRVEARHRAGRADDSDVAVLEAVIAASDRAGLSGASTEARVLAAELAAAAGDVDTAERHLAATARAIGLAARCRRDLVSARVLARVGRPDDALARCTATVDEFAVLTSALGGTELRAHIATHVAAVVDFAVSLAAARGDPAQVFAWSERHRASALAAAPVRPPADPELARELDHLRASITELDGKARAGVNDPALAHRCAELRDRVRRRTRHVAGAAGHVLAAEGLPEIDSAGVSAWLSYVEVDGDLAAVRVVPDRISVVRLGPMEAARREAGALMTTLAMHLGATGRGRSRDPEVVRQAAYDAGRLLLDPLELPDGPVVLSPCSGLHQVPWGLLPGLYSRAFALAPSLALWRRCRDRSASAPVTALIATGPGVPTAEAEAGAVAACYSDATVVAGGDATVAAVGDAMGGVDVVHIVCHGSFAAANPMFSALRLADGPMFVYDLERLDPPPQVVVLSACSVGSHASPAGNEILGLTAALLATGPRAVIGATVPVPDSTSTIALMTGLHQALAAGVGPAEALRRAREVEPIVGGAFACHGAGD
jgi:tetratricopeptide (TPR) repeat protein